MQNRVRSKIKEGHAYVFLAQMPLCSQAHMFGAFSKLFKKSDAVPNFPNPSETAPQAPPRVSPLTQTLPKLKAPNQPELSQQASSSSCASDDLHIPYSSVIKHVPSELWGQLAPAGVAGFNLTVSRHFVLSQLPHGAVKVSFGEIRRGAPSGAFVNIASEDDRSINLPLGEILSQLHPDAFSCRTGQKRIAVHHDLPDVFGSRIHNAPIRVMERCQVSTEISARRETAHDRPSSPIPVDQEQSCSAKSTIEFKAQTLELSNSANDSGRPNPAKVKLVAAKTAPRGQQSNQALTVRLPPKPSVGGNGSNDPDEPNKLASLRLKGPLAQGSFTIGLDTIAEHWPDAIRQELAQLKIPDGKLALPPIEICEGLKRGRVQYSWRTLRSWIQPAPQFISCVNDDQVLELPLKTLTPAFLDFIRSNPINRNSAAADNITEFFRRAEQTSGETPVPFKPSQRIIESSAHQSALAISQSPSTASHPPDHVNRPPNQHNSFEDEKRAETESKLRGKDGNLCLPLSTVSGNWPESVLRDISQFNLANAVIELPVDVIETGLKNGRVEFPWHQVCGWLKPGSKAARLSINGEVQVQLPLAIIAPLFLRAHAPTPAGRKRREVLDNIPDLFTSGQTPFKQSAAASADSEVITAAPTKVHNTVDGSADRAPTNLSELFSESTKTTWTPNEIVQRATQLKGVIGALIALQDGLLVASSLPPDIKTEMIAAFIPQIFGRLSQYSKELQLGNASAVGFTIENGTLQIYNAGIIYFAALCSSSEDVPVRQLQLIATELSRHTK